MGEALRNLGQCGLYLGVVHAEDAFGDGDGARVPAGHLLTRDEGDGDHPPGIGEQAHRGRVTVGPDHAPGRERA